MTSCIKSAFARKIRLLTLRNRFASRLFVIKEELRHIWKFWIARDRFTAPNFHSQVHEVMNFAAWYNCIGHWGVGGSSDLVETSSLGQKVMSDCLATAVARGNLSTYKGKQSLMRCGVAVPCSSNSQMPSSVFATKVVECLRAGVVFGKSLISAFLQTECGSRRIIGSLPAIS